MITIAITAGGTSENIDGIRKITNVSTGSLGWNCLEAVFAHMEKESISDFLVYYIHTESALRKKLNVKPSSNVKFIEASDAESVYNTVDALTKETKIDYFIHSMAISDFTYSYSIGIEQLVDEISNLIKDDNQFMRDRLRNLMKNPSNKLGDDKKISSSDDLFMALKTTKKVIPLIKKNNSDTLLVGFKLLKSVSEEELLKEARSLTDKNDCDMVFANEVSRISETNHTGILIRNGEIIARPSGKKQIAESIIQNLFKAK